MCYHSIDLTLILKLPDLFLQPHPQLVFSCTIVYMAVHHFRHQFHCQMLVRFFAE